MKTHWQDVSIPISRNNPAKVLRSQLNIIQVFLEMAMFFSQGRKWGEWCQGYTGCCPNPDLGELRQQLFLTTGRRPWISNLTSSPPQAVLLQRNACSAFELRRISAAPPEVLFPPQKACSKVSFAGKFDPSSIDFSPLAWPEHSPHRLKL
jgi:hypothetical protein